MQSHDQHAPQLLDTKVSILLYADDIVLLSKSLSGLQHRLIFCSCFALKSFNCQYVQNLVIFNDFCCSHTDHVTYSCQQLHIVPEYIYLGIVLHKSGSYRHAISKLTAAGKRALFAMQYRCSDLGIDDISPAMFSVFFACATCSVLWVSKMGFGACKRLGVHVLCSSFIPKLKAHFTCPQINTY